MYNPYNPLFPFFQTQTRVSPMSTPTPTLPHSHKFIQTKKIASITVATVDGRGAQSELPAGGAELRGDGNTSTQRIDQGPEVRTH